MAKAKKFFSNYKWAIIVFFIVISGISAASITSKKTFYEQYIAP